MFKRKDSKKKKRSRREAEGGRGPQEEQTLEELPQVWLPAPQEPHLDNADTEHLPEGEEQHRLANFLAREEENRPGGGWDDGEELNYAQIAASFGGMLQLENEGEREGINIPTQPNGNIRPSLRKYEQVDEVFDFDEAILEERDGVLQHSRLPSHKSPALSAVQSETHSLFNYAQTSTYHVHYLGELNNISKSWETSGNAGDGQDERDSNDPNNLLNLIEHAQRQGMIPWTHQKGNQRILVISKYGIKVTDTKRQRVYIRHTLHKIVTAVHFIDTRGHSLLAVKMNNTTASEDEGTNEDAFDLFVYECESENQATEVCVMLGQVFDSVLNKMKLEDNLGLTH